MIRKVHKRICNCAVLIGATTMCGLSEFNIEEKNLNKSWKKVTCKNCLKKKTGKRLCE